MMSIVHLPPIVEAVMFPRTSVLAIRLSAEQITTVQIAIAMAMHVML